MAKKEQDVTDEAADVVGELDLKTVEELIEALTAYLALPPRERFQQAPQLSLIARSVLARDRGLVVLGVLEPAGRRPLVQTVADEWRVSRYTLSNLAKAARERQDAEEAAAKAAKPAAKK